MPKSIIITCAPTGGTHPHTEHVSAPAGQSVLLGGNLQVGLIDGRS